MQPNILIFCPDDMGREYLKVYNDLRDPSVKMPANLLVKTPNIDRLAQSGVTFTRAYSQPWCSPTRACWLTGRHGYQTGIGSLAEGANQPLLASEVCLPSALKTATDNAYVTSAFVKWHLSEWTTRGGAYQHPVRMGFDHFEGHLRNLDAGESYDCFEGFSADPGADGTTVEVKRYQVNEWAPKYYADRAVEWMKEQEQPWLCYFAINLPHSPYNRPPSYAYDTDSYDLPDYAPPDSSDASVPTFHKAMLQGLDWTLGYLLEQMPQAQRANTIVMFWSDNGTSSAAFDTTGTTGINLTPYLGAGYTGKAKRTVYELGCNIPLIVAGPKVTDPGSNNASLISPVDLFKTVIELADGTYADVPLPAGGTRSSISFTTSLTDGATSARTYVPIDLFGPNGPNVDCSTQGSRAVVQSQYKLLRQNTTGIGSWPANGGLPISGYEMYDFDTDPNETINLLRGQPTNISLNPTQEAAYLALQAIYDTAFSTL